MAEFKKVDDLKTYQALIETSEQKEEHVVLKYGGPCNEHGGHGIHVLYGAPCNILNNVDFEGRDHIGLRYGAPCSPPYVIVKYGGPCSELKK